MKKAKSILPVIFLFLMVIMLTPKTANADPVGITIRKSKVTLYVGADKVSHRRFIMAPKLSGISGKVKYKTSNKKIAKVNSKGYVYAVSPGTAVVLAYLKDNGKLYTARCKVVVKKPDITFALSQLNLKLGESTSVLVTSTPSAPIKWSVRNSKRVSIDSTGLATGLKAGGTFIYAEANGVKKRLLVKVAADGDQPVVTPTPTPVPVDNTYNDYVNKISSSGAIDYCVYDIDKDGLPELFLEYEVAPISGGMQFTVFKYKSGTFTEVGQIGGIGKTIAYLSSAPGRNGIINWSVVRGYESVWVYTLNNNTLTYEKLYVSDLLTEGKYYLFNDGYNSPYTLNSFVDSGQYFVNFKSPYLAGSLMLQRSLITNYKALKEALNVSDGQASEATISIPEAMEINQGDTQRIVAVVNGPSQNVEWSSSDENIVTVSSDGVVTGVNWGSAVVYAKANGKVASCAVRVKRNYYSDYYKLIEARQKTYGQGVVNSTQLSGPYKQLNGVGIVRLLDMNNDGVDELVIGYMNREGSGGGAKNELWTFYNNELVKLNKDDSAFGWGQYISYTIEFNYLDDQWCYVDGSWRYGEAKRDAYRLDKGRLINAHSLYETLKTGSGMNYYVDGTLTTKASYDEKLNSWNKNGMSYAYYGKEEELTKILRETQSTIIKLKNGGN